MYVRRHSTNCISYPFNIELKNNYFLNKSLDLLNEKKIFFSIALRPILD